MRSSWAAASLQRPGPRPRFASSMHRHPTLRILTVSSTSSSSRSPSPTDARCRYARRSRASHPTFRVDTNRRSAAEDTAGDIFVPYYPLWQIMRKGKNFVLGAGSVIPANTEATLTAQPNGSNRDRHAAPATGQHRARQRNLPGIAACDAVWPRRDAAAPPDASPHPLARPVSIASPLARCFDDRFLEEPFEKVRYPRAHSNDVRPLRFLRSPPFPRFAATPAPNATLSPCRRARRSAFVTGIQKDLMARFPTPADAVKAGYFRYSNED